LGDNLSQGTTKPLHPGERVQHLLFKKIINPSDSGGISGFGEHNKKGFKFKKKGNLIKREF